MFVPILAYPGTFLDHPEAHDIQSLVGEVETALAEAALALRAFDVPDEPYVPFAERWATDVADANDDEEAVLGELGMSFRPLNHLPFEREMAVRKVRRRTMNGLLPAGYDLTEKFLSAKVFVSRLALIRRLMRRLAEFDGLRPAADIAMQEIDRLAPDLKGLRDTSEHREDRALQQARDRRIPCPEPLAGQEHIFKGIWMDGLLEGSCFSAPMEGGLMGRIAINEATLSDITEAIQSFALALPFRDPMVRIWP